MTLKDQETNEIFVARDAGRSTVDVQIGKACADDTRIIRLTAEEARRLAALILFQASRLERPREDRRLPFAEPERRSA